MTATTKTRKANTKAQKTVTVLYTYIFKHLNRVCFTVLSYEGQHKVDRDERIVEADTYNTCFNNGKGSCTCRANAEFHLECYHITQLAPIAAAKLAAKEATHTTPISEPKTEKDASLQAEWGSPVYDKAHYTAKFARADAMNAAYNRQLTPVPGKDGLYVPEDAPTFEKMDRAAYDAMFDPSGLAFL